MLLDEAQTAVSDLLEALHESLDDYQDNLQRLHRAEIAQEFNDAMNRRTQLVNTLEERIKEELSLRPRAADTEREDFNHLWSKLKSLVFDEQEMMLQERAEQERQLISLVARCESFDYPESINLQLKILHQHLAEQLDQIKQFQQSV
ncbi:DUF2383 domain-containing protein [Oceanospirillum linum]|uniref:DUF2383 domain-containing protein n=1 Tax=Oceanospirillum linum TaxID=966 RepID=A0A1T1HFV4_OCELI|nr:DUF2383 domain-containing protein [Oceanospirillum linum]OOV88734.1 hypothetical protein BTA35_0204445 [Oceanospirillum linum]SEG01336.1 protein of unknown function [Oleiphilus messinensis]SMP21807.1 protein of unknown function [Oceanospirillum linum]